MLNSKTIHELHEGLKKKDFSAREILEAVKKKIGSTEKESGAYLFLNFEAAEKKALEVDEKIRRGEEISTVAGIPIAIKDNICVEGMPATCASKILENFIPPYDATVIKKLKKADAVIIGKTNMDEFAMGSSTENSAYKVTRNPWNPETVPGGSSGGSAVAVAADTAIASLGSDTGGSIRQPASFCGVVGFKPTYGRVSRYGLIAFASSLDQIGPITKDVKDAAIISSVISGFDEADATSANIAVPDFSGIIANTGVKGLRIGIPREFFSEGIDADVEKKVKEAIRAYGELGAEIIGISLPHSTKYAVATYYILATAEASSNLARYDGMKYGRRADADNLQNCYMKSRAEGFGPEVKRRIMLGTYALSAGYYDAFYLKSQKVRKLIKDELTEAFKLVDIILTPTAPTTAFKIGEKMNNPLSMYLSDIFTISVNLGGNPAISLPCGKDSNNMPIGLQLIGKLFDDETVLRAANSFENNVYKIKY